MNKKPKTRMAIILDKSGSMSSTKKDAIEGLNEQIQQAKERASTHDLRCSLVTFNGEVFEHLWDTPAEELKEASDEDYKPNGGTAMRDAIGYTVQKLLNTAKEDDNETAYLIYIISDGATNSDAHYSPAIIKELTQGCEATGRWTFTYMGCDPKYMEQLHRQTGTPISNMAAWSNSSSGSTKRAFTNQKVRMDKYFDERLVGKLQTANYASDVACCADFTKDVTEQPVVLDLDTPEVVQPLPAAPVDLRELLEKMPKYMNIYDDGHSVVMGGGLFSNTVGVQWNPVNQNQNFSSNVR